MNKILIVSSEFPPQPGGIGNHACNLAGQLTRQGKKVVVLTNSRSGDGAIEESFDNKQPYEVVRISRNRFGFLTYFQRWKTFKKLIASEQPNFIIASGKFSLWMLGLIQSSEKLKKIAVIHGSEVNLPTGWEKKLVDKALNRMNVVIAVSKYTKQLINHLNLSHVEVIPNGFNSKGFKSKIEVHNRVGIQLITVGAVSERKGQHNVIRTLPHLRKRHPDIHYHMVGIPSEKEKLLELVHELDIEDLVSFHGVLNQEEMTSLVSNCDIFVMLSEATKKGAVEGFGIALLEANYLGVPTIGSLNCGIEDAIDNYKSGILVPYNDSRAFEEAINEITINKELYRNNAKVWAEKHKWEVIIGKYIEILDEILLDTI